MRNKKRWLAFLMAACMVVSTPSSALGVPQTVHAAAESTQAEERAGAADIESIKANAKMVAEFHGDDRIFDGTKVVDVSEKAAEVKTVSNGSIIFRFKVDPDMTGPAVLLGAKDNKLDLQDGLPSGNDVVSFFMKNTGMFRFSLKPTQAEKGGITFADGNWHSIVYSSESGKKTMRLTIDGAELFNNTVSSNAGLFANLSVLDKITVGGHKNPDGTIKHPFKGMISYVIVTDQVLTDAEAITLTEQEKNRRDPEDPVVSGSNISQMFDTDGKNTWVFTGGEDVQGGFAQVGGARNYVGQYEEYIRWKKTTSNENTRQRYTINTAKAGQTLQDVLDHWADRVTAFDPRAVAYMIGSEDYAKGEQGIDAFKESLRDFINKAVALRENKGFAVIQKPYATKAEADNTKIQKYCEAVDAVVNEFADDTKYANIVVVDHFTETNNDTFKTGKLNAAGKLNVQGHFEIGKQLSAATIKDTAGFPADKCALDKVAEEAPSVYKDVTPTVTAAAGKLDVSIPATENSTSWKYILKIDDVEITDTVSSNQFAITDLPEGKEYSLTIRTGDGVTQLRTVAGVIEAGKQSSLKVPKLDANQQALKAKMDSNKAMTWLFMGDSITHAAMWTDGYDGVALSFEKFLKDDLKRTDDVVINTAVSGATAASTLNTVEQRLNKYSPDVVSIMLGTNDCTAQTPEQYKTNMKQLIEMAKKKGAIVILRTPTSGERNNNLPPYLEKLKELAAEDTSLIYIDQFTTMKQAYTLFPKVYDDFYLDYPGMGLHPGPNGHVIMAKQFIRGCGLWTDDSNITNLFHKILFKDENNTTDVPVRRTPDKISLSVSDLAEATGKQIGSITITATDGTKTYTTSTELGGDETILSNLKRNTTYTVNVKAYLTNELKTVTFSPKTVELSDDIVVDFGVKLSNRKVQTLTADTEVGSLSVDRMAPEGDYTYELCPGDNSTGNTFFKIQGNKLIVAQDLVEGTEYAVRVKAVNTANNKFAKEEVFTILAVGSGFLAEKSDVEIAEGSTVKITGEEADQIKNMEEGTIIVQFTGSGTSGIQSLFSAANGSTGNNDRHFHVYVTPDGVVGFENRNTNGEFNIGGKSATGAIRYTYKGKEAKNTIAFKADKDAGQYKLFANGKLVMTLDKGTAYKFINNITGIDTVDLGGTIRGGAKQYPFAGTIHSIAIYRAPMTDEALMEATGVTSFESNLQQIFHSNDATGSNYFRIPSLYTMKNGTIVSAIDARFGGTHDSPNNIDIAFAKSVDGGKTWLDATMPMHFDDFADDKMVFPVGNGNRVNASASYIDPSLLEDETTGRLFLFADAMPSGIGSPQAQTGSGYKVINGKSYRKLHKKGEAAYDYSIHEDKYIYNDTNNQKTEYYVNDYFEIMKDGQALTVKQKSASYDPTTSGGTVVISETNKDVAMNIMYDTAEFQAFPTTYLYLMYSDDNGDTWSAPVDLNQQVKKDTDRNLVNGPGRGIQIKNGPHKGRLIFPVYQGSSCDIIYSDDHGEHWTFADGPALGAGVEMSESQIVEMPDGSLKAYARANASKIAMATSLDGGETWNTGEYVPGLKQPGWGSQLSVINYSAPIDGKPAIILSSPDGVGSNRRDGHVRIGLITDTGATGYDKYQIDWAYDYQVDDTNARYGYSCATELPDHNIGILYEKYDSYAPAELQSMDAIKYEVFTMETLKENPVLGGIEITAPTKKEYTVGEAIDVTGLTVTAVYYNGTRVSVDTGKYTVTGFDSTTAGEKTVTVTYQEKTATFKVTVTAPVVLSSINITAPTKKEYKVGETLDVTGLTVTAVYSDGTTKSVAAADYTVTGFDSATAGEKTVTVSYQGKTATFKVTVTASVVLSSINVTAPTKNEYMVGEALDVTGLTVTAVYSDGTTKSVAAADYTVTGFDSATAGEKTVTVSYQGKTATFKVTVKAAVAPPSATSISNAVVTLATDSVSYDGTAKTPAVATVMVNGKLLTAGTDYTVTYTNNINIGTATVTITGKGNYTGTATKTFTIGKGVMSGAAVKLSASSVYYNGKAQTPAVTVTLGSKVLKAGTDYMVSYANNQNIGTAKVTIIGLGNYIGMTTKTFTIAAKTGSTFTVGAYKYKVTGASAVAFQGLKSAKTKKVTIPKTVKIGGKTFKVTSIANKALCKKKVTSVTIGANVTTIGTSAFEGCAKLTKVTIGKNVTKIGNKAFFKAKKLGSIKVSSAKMKKVGKNAFKDVKATVKIKVPKKKLKAYKKLLKGKGLNKKAKITK